MNLYKIYHDICNRGHERGTKRKKGFELHHILPKSMNGTNDSSNLCLLTPKEHYVVHHCLARTGNKKMIYAFWRMINGKYNFNISAKEFEFSKKLIINELSEVNKNRVYKPHSMETKEKIRNKAIGRKASEETREKLSAIHKNRYINNKELRLIISKQQKGKTVSEETKSRMKKSRSFQIMKPHTIETKIKMQITKAYNDHCKRIEQDEFIFPLECYGNVKEKTNRIL